MEYLRIVILLLILCLCHAGIRHIKKGKMKITIASMVPHNNKKLKTKVLKTVQVPNKEECIKECSSTNGCQSANYDKKSKCDVLATNRHVNKTNFVNESGSIHISLNNKGCERGMCLNNGKCIPHYKDNTFQCQCSDKYEGIYCQKKKKLLRPNWLFSFNHNTTNTGTSSTDAIITAAYGNDGKGFLMGDPNRKGKYLHCHLKCIQSYITWEPWIDPKLSKEGITIAMWIQMKPGERERQAGAGVAYARSHVICYNGKGYCLAFSNAEDLWIFTVYTHRGFAVRIPMTISESLNWHYVGFSFNRTTLIGFVDSTLGFTDVKNGDDSSIEGKHTRLFHPGSAGIYNIDEFKVWYQGFTPDQLKQLYGDERRRIYGEN